LVTSINWLSEGQVIKSDLQYSPLAISLVQKGKDLSNPARVGMIQSVTNRGKVDPQVPMKILCD